MKIEIVGIIHFDPLCRDRYIDWLSIIGSKYKEPPFFIAIEWDENIFQKVKNQRSHFRELLKEKYPTSDEISIEKLTMTLAFEGDTHLEFFPITPILWLDNDVIINNQTIVDNYSEDRLKIYEGYFGDEKKLSNNNLLGLSITAWRKLYYSVNSSSSNTNRDNKFFEFLTNNLDDKCDSWVIVIVGANHTKNDPGRLAFLLREKGYEVITNLLNCDYSL